METRGRKERSAVGVHGVALLYGERLEHGASWVHSCSVAQLGGRSARPIWPGSGAVLQLNEPWSAHTGKIGQAQGRIKCFFSFGSFGVLAQVPGGRCRPDHSSYTGGPGADALRRAPASSPSGHVCGVTVALIGLFCPLR